MCAALSLSVRKLSRNFHACRPRVPTVCDAILEWTPDSAASPPMLLPADAAPSLSTALQEQLGIKLESAKGPVEVLVIDHAERATKN